jgi:hypothetical protein
MEDPASTADNEASFYEKLGQAYQIAPWEIPARMTVAQWLGFFLRENPRDPAEILAVINRQRAKHGRPPADLFEHPTEGG